MAWRWDKKDTVEDYTKLDLKDLMKHVHGMYADLTMSWGINNQNRISVIVDLCEPEVKFTYFTISPDGARKDISYSIPLETTACHFGGVRYWYKCQALRQDGNICSRRVRALFRNGDYFVCRHCLNLSYQSRQRTTSRAFPELALMRKLIKQEEKINKLFPIKKLTYQGKLTKRYKKYLSLTGNLA